MEYLVFIHEIGENSKGNFEYDLIFSSDGLFEVIGEDWEQTPAEGLPQAPLNHASSIHRLETKMDLELVKNSPFFCMKDTIDKVIALAWERNKDESFDASRFHIHYGILLDDIKNIFFERGMKIKKIE